MSADWLQITHDLAQIEDLAAIRREALRRSRAVVECDWLALVTWPGEALAPSFAALADDEIVRAVAVIARRTHEGIAWSVRAERAMARTDDLRRERRWPTYTAALLAQTPIRSALGLPLTVGGEELGALILYSASAGDFSPERQDLARDISECVAIGLSRVAARINAVNLETALDSNRRIAMAIGIVMASLRVPEPEAFDVLRAYSQHHHLKLREVADYVVRTGALPDGPQAHASPRGNRGAAPRL